MKFSALALVIATASAGRGGQRDRNDGGEPILRRWWPNEGTWAACDTDDDGNMDLAEMTACFHQTIPEDYWGYFDPVIERVFNRLDFDGDGELEPNEWEDLRP